MGMCKKRVDGKAQVTASELSQFGDGGNSHLPGLPRCEKDGSRFFESLLQIPLGLSADARQIHQAFPDGATSTSAVATSLSSSSSGLERWPGERDEIVAGHPVAATLSKAAEDRRYPEPCENIVRVMSSIGQFSQEGRVCSIDGVTVPAGKSQLIFLVFSRWRALFNPYAKPDEIYIGNRVYDRVMTTDFIQRQLWGFGTCEFIDYLSTIMEKKPELLIAMWLRRWHDIDRLTPFGGSKEKKSLYDDFELHPLLILNSGARDSFLAPWAIMSELERIIEIAHQMRAARDVTATAIREHVANYETIDDLLADQSEVGRHIKSLLLSSRFIHHTMNGSDHSYADTDLLARLKHSIECSGALQPSFRRVECAGGASPGFYMNGLDLAHFVPASLHQIWMGMKAQLATGDARQPILRDTVKRTRRGMWLTIVILANICPLTAQALTAKLIRKKPKPLKKGEKRKYIPVARAEPGWLTIYPTAMILGSGGYDADQRDSEALEAFVAERFPNHAERIEKLLLTLLQAFKNLPKKIVTSAVDSASRVGEPGWTKGAYHQAWFEPDAEIEFLGKCSNFILYDRDLDAVAKGFDHLAELEPHLPPRNSGPPKKRRLPLVHPLENTQQIFRRQLHPLQIPDRIPNEEVRQQANRKFAILQESARRLPAWSPFSSDPGLAERIGSLPKGVNGSSGSAWAFAEKEIILSRDWSWQRDWDPCGRI